MSACGILHQTSLLRGIFVLLTLCVGSRYCSDVIVFSMRFPQLLWTEGLQNPRSSEFQQAATKIENSIRNGFANDTNLRGVKVTGFRKGSLISEVELTYVAGLKFSSPLDKLSSFISDGNLGNIAVDSSSIDVLDYTCSQALGMENGRIPDDGITSGERVFSVPPKRARLNSPGPGWATKHSYITGHVYLQVDFQEKALLTGIATQGSSYRDGSWLLSYYFQTSSDGNRWTYYGGRDSDDYEIFEGNNDVNTTIRRTLEYPVKARYVRVFYHLFWRWPSFRIEFYGCPIPRTVFLPVKAPPAITMAPRITTTGTRADGGDDGKSGDETAELVVKIFFSIVSVLILIGAILKCSRMHKKRTETQNSEQDPKSNAVSEPT